MKLQILSDLHLEFGLMEMVPKGEILILAGDVGVVKKPAYLDLVEEWAKMFEHVLYVPGNHEYYKGDIEKSFEKLRDWSFTTDNIAVLDNDYVILGGVMFLGATLWSDMTNKASAIMANSMMNDFRIIRKNNYAHPFLAQDATERHLNSAQWLRTALARLPKNKKVVITHHAPSFKSIAPQYEGNALNEAYASNLEDDIEIGRPELWIHGHMHESFDYMVHDTRVICNPRGYVGYELNANFNPTLVIDI